MANANGPATMAGFYRTLSVPAFWDGCRAVRADLDGGRADGLRRIEAIQRGVAAGVPVDEIPELREWLAHDRG